MDNVIYSRSFWDAIKLLPEDMQPHLIWAIRDYAYDDIMPTNLSNIEQGFFVAFKPYFDSRRAKAESKGLTNGRRGGQLGNTNASKGNRIENEKTNGKTNENEKTNGKTNENEKTNGKTNENECDHSFCTNTNTNMINTNTDEEEDTNSGQAASSSSSSSLTESFSPSDFILKWWNTMGQKYPYLKKIEYISRTLEQKIIAGYEFALTCCQGDVNRAKNMLAKAVVNMAQSNFFAQNQGKATLTWLFSSTDNLEKCANGQYNDY